MATVLWIALGGALGTVARYLAARGVQGLGGGGVFPYGTLFVNLLGCLLIGVLAAGLTDDTPVRSTVKAALIVGCLGGFTTFSSFGLETLQLLRDGHLLAAALYVAGSNVGGILLAFVGFRLAGS